MIKIILRVESTLLFIVALYVYHLFHGNWIVFILLLLTPDASVVGYLKNKKIGATIYNLVHNYVLALLLIALGEFVVSSIMLTHIGIILFAHVAMDRFFGFGLKYPTNFKGTHLLKI